MSALFCAEVLGLCVRIDVPDELSPPQRDTLRAAWAGALTDRTDSDLTVEFGSADAFDRSMERLTIDVTLAALAEVGSRALMFHAAGVADEQGRVAAFVGPSGRGKTTLSRCLGSHYGYVSDETIAVWPDLTVAPYRKPLSLVRTGQPKQQMSPAEAGLQDLPDVELRLASLVVLARDAEHNDVRIEPLTLTEALPQLVTQMSYLREQQHPLQTVARLCDSVGGVLRLSYAESADIPARMAEIFDHEHRVADWRPVTWTEHAGPWRSDRVADAIAVDEQLIVMADDMIRVLDGIAPVIWRSASEGRDIDGITVDVVSEFGSPSDGDARAHVEAAIGELVDAGLLSHR